MAQTWRVTPGKVAIFRTIDAFLAPLSLMKAKPPTSAGSVERILVVEPWLLGDVVIATAALKALRDLFPSAKITLLGKKHAAELLSNSGLVDDVIVYDLPWTASTAKYDPRRYDVRSMSSLIRRLRETRFDVTIDARMDLRSNLLTFATRAPIRLGYDFGGGSSLLTHAAPIAPDANHRVDDWLALVAELSRIAGANPGRTFTREAGYYPTLAVSGSESVWAERWLSEHGYSRSSPLVAVHGGASNPRRRWPLESYRRIAELLADRWQAEFIFFPEPGDAQHFEPARAEARVSLREMMALFSRCDLILCNDSGPMHIADALGIPVVAVFLTGNPRWHHPSREFQKWVGEGTGHELLAAPTEDEVLDAANESLSERTRTRGSELLSHT